jgi:hypothetical protein
MLLAQFFEIQKAGAGHFLPIFVVGILRWPTQMVCPSILIFPVIFGSSTLVVVTISQKQAFSTTTHVLLAPDSISTTEAFASARHHLSCPWSQWSSFV